MNQQVSIKEVIKSATQSMETDGISQAYINQLSLTWNALTEYLSDNNSYFTREIGIQFLKEKYGTKSTVMGGTVVDISSTELRVPENTTGDTLLDPNVRAYAQTHGLYV